jgi:urea transport system ATP-binding protein
MILLTILLVEQKLPFARRVAKNFCIPDKGRNVATDAMENLGEEIINSYLTV